MAAILGVFFPSITFAQVVLSEIMYDLPVGSDSDREWIEVFNSGGSVLTLTEWKIFEGGVNHSISPYTGNDTLGSGAYAVIADNPTKFLEDWPGYSGLLFDSAFSLSNTGETLTLRCCGNDLMDKDSVTYNSESGASGDGNTLQRASVSSASITAAAAGPGSGSLSASAPAADNTQTSGQSTQQNQTKTTSNSNTTGSASSSSYVPPPEPEIFVDVGGDRTVIVAADVQFNARAYNAKKETVDHVRFLWNFGDGTTAEGPAVMHHFEYPGRYAVIVDIAENKQAASDRIIVTAEPARLAFSALPDGGVAIENRAGRDLDLSRWVVRSFGREFLLPEHSVILAGATTRISQKTLGFSGSLQTELAYPNGVFALRAGEIIGDGEIAEAALSSAEVSAPVVASPPVPPVFRTEPEPVLEAVDQETSDALSDPEIPASTPGVVSEGQAAAATSALPGPSRWWLAAIALAGVAGAALFFARRFKKGEWDIVEESSN